MKALSAVHIALLKRADDRARGLAQRDKLKAKIWPLKAVTKRKLGDREGDPLRDLRDPEKPTVSITLASLEKLAMVLEWDLCDLLGCAPKSEKPPPLNPEFIQSAIYITAELLSAGVPGCPLNERPLAVAQYITAVYQSLSRLEEQEPGKGSDPTALAAVLETLRANITE